MNARGLVCTRCQAPLIDVGVVSSSELTPCQSCSSPLRAEIFPAFFRQPALGEKPVNVITEGESSCFYHIHKKAVVSCANCGRFLCALCDLELNGKHLCPACLERGQQKQTLKNLEFHRTRYDNIVLVLAIFPLIMWPFTLVTAPATIFLAVRYWNSPTSIVRPTRIRLVLAIVLAALQIAGWGVGLYSVFSS
jgi:hypothetical protein